MPELNPFDLVGNTVEIDGDEREIQRVELGKLSEPGSDLKLDNGETIPQEELEEKLESGEAEVVA